jgi:glycine betaine/proline transport system ATP-binding protein
MRDGVIEQVGSADEILAEPANDYVQKFLKGIDVAKILDANSIAKWPRGIVRETESPAVAIHRMKKADSDYLFVIGAKRKLVGLVTREDVLPLSRKRHASFTDVIRKADKITGDTIMNDVYPALREAERALAVVDENDHLLGIITQNTLVESLEERKGGNGVAEL